MITISLCMIVKDEQDTLGRCLLSINEAVDEIIIVDTGSTDGTKEIARKWTNQIVNLEWTHDFSRARNRSHKEATMDYILWLDADDILLPEDLQKLLQLKQSLSPAVDVVSMLYNCDFDESGNVTLQVRRARLVKRSKNYLWMGTVHEDLLIEEGTFLDSDIVITHKKNQSTSDPDRNLRIYELLLSSGQDFTRRDILHYAMELHQHRLFETAIQYYQKFIDLEHLTKEDKIHAYAKLADCYYYLGDREKEREITFKSFEYDIPRPEACCRLGYYFLESQQFEQAVFWYRLAIESPIPNKSWAISNQVSRTWLPHMQLGICYYQLGEYELSYHHNKIVSEYRPKDQGVINNMYLLEELIVQNKTKTNPM
ncbi:glycosyltransferase [Paenibacillus psychroresistens]|uniref:Glycosyltransferase n=1 Tax=Paenibacillus psychroresistens TaxID=1778678 RepID=A0A6B8RVU4_9BACL|nr:glycosyltransferase [Paenibacillus psychroresistens]QGQ99765.1 glycosyltransferase [Paenibacillus psychroresistens]